MPTYPSTINRRTVISFPLNDNRADITTGIESGSLYLNKVLFQKQFNPGEANSDRFEVTLFDCDDISGETIAVTLKEYPENSSIPNNYPIFYGVVDSCLKEDNGLNRKLVAYDLMYTIGNTDATSWWNNYWDNTTTSTVGDLFESLLTTFNITLETNSASVVQNIDTYDLSIMQFNGVQAITVGTVLSYICQILLCNPHFDGYGELKLIYLGSTSYGASDITGAYEDANSHFEDYTTPAIDRVVIYGETDVIAGSYGSGDNVYVIKNNPLLYNLSESTYNDLAETFYDILSNEYVPFICYRPANIKMIVSDMNLNFGSMVYTQQHGLSFVSAMELSGPMLVEQTIVSSGNQYLTPDDFNITDAKLGATMEQATTTSRHFVWVPNVGAFVTTDNTPAGQAPVNNYSRLDETGLYVAVSGKEVAHFGVDENNDPISVLGSTDVGSTSVKMSEEGLSAGRQVSDTQKIDYFDISVPPVTQIYANVQATLVVQNNQGYLQLPTTYSYLSASRISYSVSNTLSGTSSQILLSQNRLNLDIALQTAFDDIFRSLKDSALTDSSTLKQWFDALEIPADKHSYTARLLSGQDVYIDFFDAQSRNCMYSEATKIRITGDGVTVQDGTTVNTRSRYLNSTDYSYNISNPYQITLNNYSYFNGTVPRTVSGLTVSAQTVRFYAMMRTGSVTYTATIGQSTDTNEGVNSIVLGDNNTVTDDSQLGVIVAGRNNTVDNNRSGDTDRDCYIVGASNTIEQKRILVFGNSNTLSDNDGGYPANNVVVGRSNSLTLSSSSGNDNRVFGVSNTVTGYDTTTIGADNNVAGMSNCVFGEGLTVNSNLNRCTVLGRYNVSPSDSDMVVIGNGSATDDRHNAVEIDDTNVTVNQQLIGKSNIYAINSESSANVFLGVENNYSTSNKIYMQADTNNRKLVIQRGTGSGSYRDLISADANNKLSGEVVSTLHLSEYDNNGLSPVHTAKKSSWTQFWSMSIPQGLWLIHGVVTFGSSTAGGYRGICLHDTGNTYSNVRDMTIVAPISGQNCIIDRWWLVPTTSTIIRYINVANSTSSDISGVNCYLSMIRLGGYSAIDYA